MRTKRLSEKESKMLVMLTWLEFMVVGIIVFFFTKPISIGVLLAAPIALHAIINFWVKGLPELEFPVFNLTAFITGACALMLAMISGGTVNSFIIACITICALCIMVEYMYVM